MSCVLALDTSGRHAEVAVARDGRVLGGAAHEGGGAFAESLLPLVDRALAAAGIAASELAVVAVVQGPGSFTGLRIGIMLAKTLAFARGLRLVAATTLDLLAKAAARGSAPGGLRTVVALADAGSGHVFAAAYTLDQVQLPVAAALPERIAHGELGVWLGAWPQPVALAAAAPESVAAARAIAAQRAGVAVVEVPSLAGELAAAVDQGAGALAAVDPVALVPVYLSASQAERARGVDLSEEVHRPAAARPRVEPS